MRGRHFGFTPEQEDEIVRRYESRESAKSIAGSIGCDQKTVIERVLRPRGLLRHGGNLGRYTEPEKAAMATRYQAGESFRAIANDYGCTPANVRWVVIKRGVEPRRTGRPSRDPVILDRIRRARADGISHRSIGEELGLSKDWVLALCREMGLPLDVRSGSNHHSWKGGRVQHRGYWQVKVDPADPIVGPMASPHTGYAPEHRAIVARSLGRPLTRSETVHHKNGDKQDNRLENLQLRQGQHGKGVRAVCLDCGSHNVGHVNI